MLRRKQKYNLQKTYEALTSSPQSYRRILKVPFALVTLALLFIVLDFGFEHTEEMDLAVDIMYYTALMSGFVILLFRYIRKKLRPHYKIWPFDIVLFGIIFLVFLNVIGLFDIPLLSDQRIKNSLLFILFLREFSALNIDFNRDYLNPAQLFLLSFGAIIFIGTLLLLLPNATKGGISVIDALFTSTSAVCVTGLIVVDTATYFTGLGQTIIMILIQIGGLGIMTFTSYFGYFFRGSTSYEHQLFLKEITNSDRIADVFSTLKKVILVTFLIEAIGALLIYASIDRELFASMSDRAFFSVFHSISGYCNAGFSILTNGLYESPFRFNYPFHLIIAFLFILGGLGFPILFNGYTILKYYLFSERSIKTLKRRRYQPWVVNLNTRVVLLTTFILIVVGTVLFYIFEYNNTLEEHSGYGKIVTAFFGAVTPRTAGFNTIDINALLFPTTMLVLFLMWIGASPASTGGGIKTTTLAIGTLNYLSLARGKDRVEIYGRELGQLTIRRAFAIISLSLIAIGLSIFLITIFEGDRQLLPIAFECVSAYSTVGLSLGLTGSLGNESKMVLIVTMFVGRVSMLTVLMAFLRKVTYLNYRYPKEELTIN